MKHLLFLTFFLILFSCADNSEKKEVTNDSTKVEAEATTESLENETTASPVKAINDKKEVSCDSFLDDYEKWVDEVIKIFEEAKKNPNDPEKAQKMMNASKEIQKWTTEWQTLHDCSTNPEYQERMTVLKLKVNKALNGM